MLVDEIMDHGSQGEMPESIAFTLWGTVGGLSGADGVPKFHQVVWLVLGTNMMSGLLIF